MDHASSQPETSNLQNRLVELGKVLQSTLQGVVEALPVEFQRPAGMARHTGTNKVFTSRLLKAIHQEDPLNVVHHLPGPDPIFRFLKSDGVVALPSSLVNRANKATTTFQHIIDQEAGDRASLQTLMSSWIGTAREEFDQRRRQAAFKAVSELKGAAVDLNVSLAILHPGAEEGMMDLVWLMGMIGLQRLRPDAQVRLDTRRMSDEGKERQPTSLDGAPMDGILELDLEGFCPHGRAPLEACQVGGTMNYLLAGNQFGPKQRSDLLLIEVNRNELRRVREDDPNRRTYLYANPIPPSQRLVLDVLLHKSLLDSEPPELLIYDTAGSGPKDPNDPISAFDQMESTDTLRYHDMADGFPEVEGYKQYPALMERVLQELAWKPEEFHLWSVDIAYPLHSSQVSVAFKAKA
ncbi:MAG: hypothetical protein ACPG31_09345 [Planctomycetota bacterium]